MGGGPTCHHLHDASRRKAVRNSPQEISPAHVRSGVSMEKWSLSCSRQRGKDIRLEGAVYSITVCWAFCRPPASQE